MPSFLYVARETASGREIRSSVEAGNEQAAIAALLNRNLLVVSIQEKVGKKGRTAGGKVGLADLVIFTRQLATMIDAGLAMVQPCRPSPTRPPIRSCAMSSKTSVPGSKPVTTFPRRSKNTPKL